jgi:hypothetical protein
MAVNISAVESTLATNKDSYMDLTHQLNNYNEIYNVNFYLNNLNNIELERLKTFESNIKAKVLKMKQEYLLTDFGINEYRLRSNIIYLGLVIMAIVFIIVSFYSSGSLKGGIAFTIAFVIILVYLLISIFVVAANAKRRRYAWEQYYWREMKKSA